METSPQQAQLAVLIDADNANAKRIDALLAEVSKYGRATTKRAYGDWTNTHLGSWKQTLARHAIQPMQQFSNTRGKNSTDSALIIDAMDLLYTERFDGFCIVSSDSDFTRLASRIREAGLTVYGFGERKTPQPFVRACDRFIFVEVLGQDSADDEIPAAASPASASGNGGGGERGRRGRRGGGTARKAAAEGTARPAAAAELVAEAPAIEPVTSVETPSVPAPAPEPVPVPVPVPVAASAPAPVAARGPVIDDPALLVPLRAAVADLGDDRGWAGLGAVGSLIGKRIPEFDPRNWGKKKLSDLFLAIPAFEVEERGEPGRSRQLFVRERREGVEASAVAAGPAVAAPPVASAESPRPPARDGQGRAQSHSGPSRPPQGGQAPRPQPPRPPQAPKPAIADHGDDEAATPVAGWAPRRDDRRPTWAITPEPIVNPAVTTAVVVEAAAEAVSVPTPFAVAEPVAAVPPPAEPAAMPAVVPARKTAAPRKASVGSTPAAETISVEAAPADAKPAATRRAPAKKSAKSAPAVADPVPAAVPKKRARAVKGTAS